MMIKFLIAVLIIAAIVIDITAKAVKQKVDVLCTDGSNGQEECRAVYFEPEGIIIDDHQNDDDADDDNHDLDDYFMNSEKCVNTNDDEVDCPTLASSGECDKNPAFMKYRCALSCNTCDDFTAAYTTMRESGGMGPCTDNEIECKNWAAMGECGYNSPYMLVHCQRSCMVCFEDTNQFGVHQELPSDDNDDDDDDERVSIEKTQTLIESSIEYMKKIWMLSTTNNRINYKCRNMDAECSQWAVNGSCAEDHDEYEYMKLNCAPACQTCESLDRSLVCPIGENNEVVFEPGELNEMFERILNDYSQEYNPQALSRPKVTRDGKPVVPNPNPNYNNGDGPWILLLDNFITNEEAAALIAAGHKKGYERSADVGIELPDGTFEDDENDGRTSTNSWCDVELCQEDPIIMPVIERIHNITGTKIENSEHIQLLRYEPGQYYHQHHDYIEYQQGLPCGVRMLTLFLYLNDVEEGGGTGFPFLNITVQPKRGSALLWPSTLDEDPEEKDKRTEHEALMVLKGIKYGANAWIHTRNYREAEDNECT